MDESGLRQWAARWMLPVFFLRRSVTILQSSRNLGQPWVWLSENVGFWLMNGNQAVTGALPKPSYTEEETMRVCLT